MIDIKTKKVLIIDLEKREAETKSFPDLMKFIGGTGLGLKLLEIYDENNPLILSIGPLNGFFPFSSKASIVLKNDGVVEDLYIGGTLSTRLKFTGLDSIVICGKSSEKMILDIQNTDVVFKDETIDMQSLGLPGKRCLIEYDGKKLLADQYFTTPESYLEKSFIEKNIKGISITGTEFFSPKNFEDYKKLYTNILEKKDGMRVEEGNYPSCSNCPMACGKSKVGEIGGNILINSLVSCQFADKIYTDIGMVFSCLNTLGYEYTHEDIENLPMLIEETIRKISK
jgi:aldehyde:ferredoxin oxidoreductase